MGVVRRDEMTTDDNTTASPPRWRRVAGMVLTTLAFLLVLFALVGPNQLGQLSPWVLVRIPVEALVGVAVLLFLPRRARIAVALAAGSLLGLLTMVKFVDMGFYAAFARPFNVLFDWSFFGPAVNFFTNATGHVGAVVAVILAILLAIGFVVLTG